MVGGFCNVIVMQGLWELEHDSGAYYLLYNRTGAQAREVEIVGRLVQFDGNYKEFVRRIEVVAQDEPVRISLRRPFAAANPSCTSPGWATVKAATPGRYDFTGFVNLFEVLWE